MSVEAPRPAATVVLARSTPVGRGIDVYLLVRQATMVFMPGAAVFPGGRVDADDWQPFPSVGTMGGQSHAPTDSLDREAVAHATAAIRELFEEAGVLLASPAASDRARADAVDARRLIEARRMLTAGERSFAEVVTELDVQLRLDWLVPIARWTTPTDEARRFAARFYLAGLPAGQTASCDGTEHLTGEWMPVHTALARQQAGSLRLAPPTLRTLEMLAVHDDVDAARRATWPARVVIQPHSLTTGPVRTLLLPGDPEFPAPPDVRLPGPTRFVLDGAGWRSASSDDPIFHSSPPCPAPIPTLD